MQSVLRPVLAPAALARAALGWLAWVLVLVAAPLLAPPLGPLALGIGLVGIIAVILVCAGGVVTQAEALAHRLGDPYGTLVLTLSIVLIEVVLISAVLLGPADHPAIARDSVMAVAMIILNLVIGLALLLGGIRHGDLAHERTGTSAYLVLLLVLSTITFALPLVIGTGGTYGPGQAVVVAVLTLGLYAVFLVRQTWTQAADFREVVGSGATPARIDGEPATEARPAGGGASGMGTRTDAMADAGASAGASASASADADAGIGAIVAAHRGEILARGGLLVATVLPIVLLSHDLASLLDDALGRLDAPPALAGAIIAGIVFLPESITAVRAALAGEIQRVVNLCHGALVSTVGLTVPAVLVIGLLTGSTVVLGEAPAHLLLLGVALAVSIVTFSAPRVTTLHGAAHLVVFGLYGLVLFS